MSAIAGMVPAPGLPGPEVLVRAILSGLAEGRYVPGQRLAEPDLMARYRVGRSTVREALGRLAAAGVVVLSPHRGAVLRFLTRREAVDVLRVTGQLLALAARQAAEAVASGADAGGLATASVEDAAASKADTVAAMLARRRYYRALTDLAGNAELARLLPMLQIHLLRAQLRSARPPGGDGLMRLAEAVLAGTPERAARAAETHVQALLDLLETIPDTWFASG